MTIREKVARAILLRRTRPDFHAVVKKAWAVDHDRELTTAAINAFLAAAAEPDKETGISWHMRPDEATEEMIIAGGNHDHVGDGYEAMHNAAPEFKWEDK